MGERERRNSKLGEQRGENGKLKGGLRCVEDGHDCRGEDGKEKRREV